MVVRNENDWLTAQVNGEVFLMSVKGQDVIGLDEVGAEIWTIIATPRTLEEVCILISKEFRVSPDQCRPDVQRILDSLKMQGAAVG
jgi:hypothetical protein